MQYTSTDSPILHYFDPERHIQIETDASGNVIGGVLSEMFSDQHSSDHVTSENKENLSKSKIGQWHPVVFYSRKMIPAEPRYETHDQGL